jgi:oxygen-independent coproporphyrinogen III oxidase
MQSALLVPWAMTLRPASPWYPADDFALYLHVPFCSHKCAYCDFYSIVPQDQNLIGKIEDALLCDTKRQLERSRWNTGQIGSLYIGGGTPSLLSPGFFKQLLKLLDFRLAENAEITVEANPESTDSKLCDTLAECGITRLSMGAQSFSSRQLEFLGRKHSANQVSRAVRIARDSGIDSIGLDLIYQLPNQTQKELRLDIEELLSYEPDHISAYGLGVEAGTPLFESLRKGKFACMDSDTAADHFRLVSQSLRDAGYLHYEVSNFCLEGKASRHNSAYWTGVPFLGIGPSASSMSVDLKGHYQRWTTDANLESYLDCITKGNLPVVENDEMDMEAELLERIFIGLRWCGGINLAGLRSIFPESRISRVIENAASADCASFLSRGESAANVGSLWCYKSDVPTRGDIVEDNSGLLRLAPEDWVIMDEIIIRLMR